MQGFSHTQSKPEVHIFHDPGGKKEPNSNKQWEKLEMSQSVYFGDLFCDSDLLNE